MGIAIAIALIITSFIVGRLTSPTRFYKNDTAWLLARLDELGVQLKVVTDSKEVKEDKITIPKDNINPVKQVDNIIDSNKKSIKSEFQKAIYNNIAKGTFNFRHHSSAYNLLPETAFRNYISQLMSEYTKTNSNVSLTCSVGFSPSYGQRFIDITIKIG